jgi:hypothetical protein
MKSFECGIVKYQKPAGIFHSQTSFEELKV